MPSKYPREWWESHLEQWKKSSLSVPAYARLHNLNKSTFHGWIARLSKKPSVLKNDNTVDYGRRNPPAFVEVTCNDKPVMSIEMVTPKGLTIRFLNGVDLDVVAQLISMMESYT